MMIKSRVRMSLCACVLFGLVFATMVLAGSDNILNTDTTGTDLVMNDLAFRDTVSYTGDPSDWTIYFHTGVRFGTDDRVIGFYDLMVPVYLSDNSILFVNPRFSHDSDEGHEWNLGGGYRQILWDDQLMLGVNAYYDLKKDGTSGKYFDQWGMGFEAMGEFDDVLAAGGGLGLTGRFNFYVPLSGSKSGAGDGAGIGGNYEFRSLGIFGGIGGGGTIYEPLTGLDYEMGMRIPYLSEYVETWAYAGGYHYRGKESGHMDGFCGRLEVIPADFLALDFEYRTDNWYGDEFHGEVKVEVPFSIGNLVQGKNPFEGLGSRFGGSRDLHARMVEPVRRDIDIKIETVSTGDGGGAGGLIEEVIFVSEGAPAGTGDGTFENPYASIDEALGDPRLGVTAFTIHVINDNGGDGIAGGGDFSTIGAVSNLLLWGSGAGHPIYGTISNMTSGYPEISSLVTVDDDAAEILGLYFNNGGIGLSIAGGSGVSIHDNLFTTGGWGVELASTGSGFNIYNNEFTAYVGIMGISGTDVRIAGNTFDVENYAIHFAYGSNSIDGLAVTGNTIAVDGTGDASGIYLGTMNGFGIGSAGNPITISGNSLTVTGTGNANGVYVRSDSDLYSDITNNTFGDVTGAVMEVLGIRLYAGNYLDADITGNAFTGAIGGGSYAVGLSLISNTSAIDAVISNNTFTGSITGGSGSYGMYFLAPDYLSADIANNTFGSINGGNFAYGMYLRSIDSIDTGITGNTFGEVTGSGSGGAYGMYLRSNGYIDADITGNTFGGVTGLGGEAYGLYFLSNDYIDADITGNTFGGVTGLGWNAYGMCLKSYNDYINAEITNNTFGEITGGGGAYGLLLSAIRLPGSGSYIDAYIADNTFGGVTGGIRAYGITLDAEDHINAEITGNTFTGSINGGNNAYGMYLNSNNYIDADITGNTLAGITATASNAYGMYLAGLVSIIADITNNTFGEVTGRNAYGMYLNSNSSLIAAITNNAFAAITATASNAYGMYLDAVDYLDADITGNTFAGITATASNAYGMYLNALDYIDADITGNTFNGSIDGGGYTYGTYLATFNHIEAEITNNTFGSIISTAGLASGMYLSSLFNSIDTVISGNTFTGSIGGGAGAYGIYIYSSDYTIADIMDNTFAGITATNNDAYGMSLYADSSYIDAVISGNAFTGSIGGGGHAYGINLESIGYYVDAEITGNTFAGITATANDAYGMYLYSDNSYVDAVISGNAFTGSIGGGGDAYGINLGSIGYYVDAEITGNTFGGITATTGNAYGMYLYAYNTSSIDAVISGNAFSGSIAGGDYAYGIELITSGGIDTDITGNEFAGITAANYDAYGMYLFTNGDIDADITNNTLGVITGGDDAHGMYLAGFTSVIAEIANNTFGGITATNNDASGIYLASIYDVNADIADNTFTGSIDGGNNAYGMYLSAWDCVYADITNNTFGAITATARYAYGMHLISDDDIEANLTGNTLGMITSTNSYVYGLYLYAGGSSGGYIDADVSNNTLAGVSGAARAFGIALLSYDHVYTDIMDNTFGGGVTSSTNNAYGIYLRSAVDNIVAGIIDNTLNDISSAIATAYGAYLSAGALIGDITGAATFFQGNSGTIDGASSRYMLYLYDVGGTSNSYTIWTGSAFTPLNGGASAVWSGNAPATGFGVMNNSIGTTHYGGTINPN